MSLRLMGVCAVLLATLCPPLFAQQRDPHIGYLYPAGGQRGTTFEVTIGGQHLKGATNAVVSGTGIEVTVKQVVKALSNKEATDLKKQMSEAQKAYLKDQQKKTKKGTQGKLYKTGPEKGNLDAVTAATREVRDLTAGEWPMDPRDLDISKLSPDEIRMLRATLFNPKKQPNAQLDTRVLLSVTISPDAELGPRDVRLLTAGGLSNPITFHVGDVCEQNEREPNEKMGLLVGNLPVVLNGQIMPGDVDRFRFQAKQGQRIVAAVRARELIPYLADAVPGWFQAVLALYDASGKEVAFVDDYRFDPDPVLRYEIPADGEYELLIRDSIYRGREDFVYRMTVGELPFIASIFPLGAQVGKHTKISLDGWNLPAKFVHIEGDGKRVGIQHMIVPGVGDLANSIAFDVDALDEISDAEPNNLPQSAQSLNLPVTINGRINRPGDWDVFRFEGREGETVVAEVLARRLNSPVDSVLKLTDSDGKELAVNDDSKDPAAGLTTHHADSRLMATLPATGCYYVHLGDTQHAGSMAHTYRLRISAPRPDFKLRVMPSSVNLFPGTTVMLSAAAIRQDGFTGDIELKVDESHPGFVLSGARLPEGVDRVWFTLTAPRDLSFESTPLKISGEATIGGRKVTRPVVPAEDMMQAFLWRHLVPVRQMWVTCMPTKWRRIPAKRASDAVVSFAPGGTGQVGFRSAARKKEPTLELELRQPAAGFTVKTVSPVAGGVDVILEADADILKPGDKGSLILEAFVLREGKTKNGKATGKTRRNSMGILPAVPFEIIAE